LWNLSFSQLWSWRLLSSGMWHCVVSSRMLVIIYMTTQRHFPEGNNLQQWTISRSKKKKKNCVNWKSIWASWVKVCLTIHA
jgi:hypothetical protein